MIEPKTLKGFRDFLPKNAKKRQYVLTVLKEVFESYGFKPLETPCIEYEEILTGKYGDEGEKLMYKFEDNGKRKVALRYDQTVPLARVVAQYQNEIKFPFKRYQIQNVWRAENTQKGRYREFLQIDADIVGTNSPLSDAEIISLAINCFEKLGFKNFNLFINDRAIFDELNIGSEFIQVLDKREKIGEKEVLNILNKMISDDKKVSKMYQSIKNSKPTERIKKIESLLSKNEKKKLFFYPWLARGLNYYTDLIFEVKIDEIGGGSVAGGGRYDKLIGAFTNKEISAVGFAFGFDRLMEAMEELNLFPNDLQTTKVLVTIPSLENAEQSLKIAQQLRDKKINTEIYLGNNLDLEKQLKYADNESIPYVLIVGDKLILKNMQKRTQEELSLDQIIEKIK